MVVPKHWHGSILAISIVHSSDRKINEQKTGICSHKTERISLKSLNNAPQIFKGSKTRWISTWRKRARVTSYGYRRNPRPMNIQVVEQKSYECMSCRPDMSITTEEYEYISVRSAQTLKCSIVLWTLCELNVHVVLYFLIYILSLSSNNAERVIFKNIFVHFLTTFSRKKNTRLWQ